MAYTNLVVQDGLLYWDVPVLALTGNWHDLVVEDCAHTHISLQAGGQSDLVLNSVDLVGLDCTHGHLGDHIFVTTATHNLTLADCSHEMTDADAAVIPLFSITAGEPGSPWYLLTLPTLEFEGQFGYRVTGGIFPKLPMLEMVEGRFGARTGIHASGIEFPLKLPTLQVEASGKSGASISLDRDIPTIIEGADGDLRFGSHLEVKLPPIDLEATVIGGLLGQVDATLPGVECEAEIIVPWGMYLESSLPAVEISASAIIDRYPTLDGILPTLKIQAYSYGGAGAVLDAKLPPVGIEADGTSGDVLTLDATLPTVIMQPVGAGGSVDGAPGAMQEETRFDDYVLRYQRTA